MSLNVSAKFALLILLPLLHGCQGTGAMDPINTVNELELQRFMGDWYVLADVATPFDKDAYEPTEHYVLNPMAWSIPPTDTKKVVRPATSSPGP